MARTVRLKVFGTNMGFYESVVAVPSKAAALRAWGTHQDLFRDGAAQVVEEPGAVKAAKAKPGVVLRRPAGSGEPFREDPRAIAATDLPKPARPSKRAPSKTPPPRDRTALDAAERALADVEAEAKAALDELQDRRRAIEAEAFSTERKFKTRRADATRAVERARRAFEKAGG